MHVFVVGPETCETRCGVAYPLVGYSPRVRFSVVFDAVTAAAVFQGVGHNDVFVHGARDDMVHRAPHLC